MNLTDIHSQTYVWPSHLHPYTPCGIFWRLFHRENMNLKWNSLLSSSIWNHYSLCATFWSGLLQGVRISYRSAKCANLFEIHTCPVEDFAKCSPQGCVDFKWINPSVWNGNNQLSSVRSIFCWCVASEDWGDNADFDLSTIKNHWQEST